MTKNESCIICGRTNYDVKYKDKSVCSARCLVEQERDHLYPLQLPVD